MPDIILTLEQFVRDVSGYAGAIDPDADLVARRIIKSVMLLEIISLVEEEFGLEVTAQDVYAGHFVSIHSMARFIQSHA
jgi:acyl carrier protein